VASTIGIKIANGEFYSIVEENSQVKKRLVLTTVHDDQQSVQIDLYRSYAGTMADAFYIGSLVLENIKPQPKGEPSIELVIASASNGNISADAVDLGASGGRQTLNVSLKSMDEENLGADIPDFEFDNDEKVPKGLYEKPEELGEKRKTGFPWLLAVLAALVLIAVGLLIWLFFFGRSNPLAAFIRPAVPVSQSRPVEPADQPDVQTPPPAAETQPPPQPAAPQPVQPVAQSAPPPVIQSPAQAPAAGASVKRQRPPAPVTSYKVPSVIPKEGVSYRIRYGDTLWDIAGAFYRNPWLYPRIARFNNIRNPNLIISGTTIVVPPRN
jgi:hypothetical protein